MIRLKKLFNCPSPAATAAGPSGGRARLRALDGGEKEAKRQAILDAADGLFAQRHELANVADIALAAGLAKGTVYLYFESKEEIYLALHLRHMERFLGALIARLDTESAFCFHELTALASLHTLSDSNDLPLGACCTGFAAGAVSSAAAENFQTCLTAWLESAGASLERHFPKLSRGEGARLLNHSYAIMIGLYSLMRSEQSGGLKCAQIQGMGSFQEEALLALTRYWTQVAGIDGGALKAAAKPQQRNKK
ncbi:MAG: TetR/AcrR family transcriptional regulator [Betaproteobacteria bacterium]